MGSCDFRSGSKTSRTLSPIYARRSTRFDPRAGGLGWPMKKETRVTHPPEAKLPDGNVPVVTPVYRSVKFTYPTIEASLSREAKDLGFDYTRDSNPTTRE